MTKIGGLDVGVKTNKLALLLVSFKGVDLFFFILLQQKSRCNYQPLQESVDKMYVHSGLDKDFDQWVFHPLLFNLMCILLHI